MKRLKGPELKMPKLKAPTVVADLYYDLLDRRLLPLVALVVVAIVAAPFLLGGTEETPPPVGQEAPIAGASGLEGGDAATLAVVEAKPGLRDYRKRLAAREPTDPFKQRYTGAAQSGGGQLNNEAATSDSSSPPSTTTPTTDAPASPAPATPSDPAAPESSPGSGGDGEGDAGNGGGDGESSLRLFAFAIDVQISKSETKANGRTVMGDPATKHKVLPTTPLPGEKAPVVTYMGANVKNAAKALLMVSNNVSSVFGDAKCLSGTDTCQLIEVEPGFPQVFVYGPNDVRYKIKVIKIEPVLTGRT